MIDVYICYDDQQADRVLELLAEAGIEALLRDRASSAFPVTAGMEAQKLIAVHADRVGEALQVIAAAIEDGVISDDGQVLGA